jgi:hypothetical protein
MGMPPIKITALHFELEQHPEIASIDGTITEKHFISLSQDQNQCSDYPDGSVGFQECSKKFFRGALKGMANCTIPGSYSTNRNFYNLYKLTRIVR